MVEVFEALTLSVPLSQEAAPARRPARLHMWISLLRHLDGIPVFGGWNLFFLFSWVRQTTCSLLPGPPLDCERARQHVGPKRAHCKTYCPRGPSACMAPFLPHRRDVTTSTWFAMSATSQR